MAVNPTLAVTCLTCGSRLKVADPSLIGSIANCPKCGAMVEIKPPQDLPQPHLDVGPRTGIDSEAITQSSIGHPDSIQATAAELDPGGNPEPFPLGDSGDPAAPPISAAPVSLPVDPAEAWQSESSRRTRQFGLVITLGGFGLLAALIAFVQFARSFGDKADSPVVAAEQTPPPDNAERESPRPDSDPSAPQPPPAAAENRDAAADRAPESTAPDRGATEPNDDRDRDREPSGAGRDDAAAASDSERPSATETAAEPISPPAADNPIAARPAAGMDNAGGEAGSLDELPAGLRRFVPLLDMSTSGGGGPPQVFEPPPTIESIRLDSAANDLSEDTPAAKRPAVDIEKALTMRLAIDQRGATLSELTLLVSQLTSVPVELELISLDLAGVSMTASPPTPAGWMPIGQWLNQTLAELGLAAEIEQERILVTALPETILAASGSALRLDDFGDQAAEVARWLRPVVGSLQAEPEAEPETDSGTDPETEQPSEQPEQPEQIEQETEDGWVWDAAESRLRVPAERSALIRTILAVEAARLIRGLPPRLPRWQTDRWMGRWSQANVARRGDDDQRIGDWPLVDDGPTGPQYDSPRPLAGWLREFANKNRVAIIVAWQDAMRHQVFPEAAELPLIEGLEIGEVLDELIGGAGLQTRDTGNSVWWIGSEGNYDRYEVITWVTIAAGSGETVARRLAEALGVDDSAQLPLAWDETTLMVRAPRYIARQLSRFARP